MPETDNTVLNTCIISGDLGRNCIFVKSIHHRASTVTPCDARNTDPFAAARTARRVNRSCRHATHQVSSDGDISISPCLDTFLYHFLCNRQSILQICHVLDILDGYPPVRFATDTGSSNGFCSTCITVIMSNRLDKHCNPGALCLPPRRDFMIDRPLRWYALPGLLMDRPGDDRH